MMEKINSNMEKYIKIVNKKNDKRGTEIISFIFS